MLTYWIALSQIHGVGPVNQKKLLKHFQHPEAIFHATKEALNESGINPTICKAVIEAQTSEHIKKAEKLYEQTLQKEINILTINAPLYPEVAKEYKEAPILLYYRGTLTNELPGIAIN
ncbi:hypothetical protein F9B85_11380 [Heliorestis acidaminivorans]|uniref:DNA-protecting protein DprA n=1 Tax=Heliorestis acidaminivorans TaxID=553427 RepID=A0A6I0F0L6_9FIRM|nr:hypothetical protein [Heliorestis acidaminivorans]KAB2951629.1 hypothetical protein F9B85_11380 [Heliorestis acidaminivorans]